MNRREFLFAAAAAPATLRSRPAQALVTADLESHVAVVDLEHGRVVRRIPTRPGPRSIERVGETAVVAHTAIGVVTVLGREELGGFEEPRYTAGSPDGRYAFVTDSGRTDVAVVDVVLGKVVTRLKLREWPRHLSLRDGRLVIGLGTASERVAVVDVRDPRRPVLERYAKPGFLVHDVGFAPNGTLWLTGGEESKVKAGNRYLAAGRAPQHVTFLAGRVFVSSGDDGTVTVVDGRTTRVPVGSYNVQFRDGRVLTPSLNAGTLCVLDSHGRLLHEVKVARSSHDAC